MILVPKLNVFNLELRKNISWILKITNAHTLFKDFVNKENYRYSKVWKNLLFWSCWKIHLFENEKTREDEENPDNAFGVVQASVE